MFIKEKVKSQVCILSNNYLTTIDPVIINCPQLIKIDVHSNQISALPDALYFARMPHLIMANLHDNAFTSLDNLLKLGCASSLQVVQRRCCGCFLLLSSSSLLLLLFWV